MYWRRSRLPGVPGGWAAEVTVRDLELATLRNAGPGEPAEAVVRARLRIRRWPRIPLLGPVLAAAQRLPWSDRVLWLTLIDSEGAGWRLTRVDFGRAGEYHLAAEPVAEPGRDPALTDAAVHELAEGDATEGAAELVVATDDDAGRRLLDLSLVDGRFAPAVVAASVRSVVRAWRRFALGEEGAYDELARLSSYEVAEYARSADLPARTAGISVAAIVRSPRPALFLRIAAVVQARDGTRERDLWWKLELDDELPEHWRLVDAYARPELRALADPPR